MIPSRSCKRLPRPLVSIVPNGSGYAPGVATNGDWAQLARTLRRFALRKGIPASLADDVVSDAMRSCIAKSIDPSDINAAGNELATVNTTNLRRMRAEKAGLESLRIEEQAKADAERQVPAKKRAEKARVSRTDKTRPERAKRRKVAPSKGMRLDEDASNARKLALAHVSAREEIGKRYRTTIADFYAWGRVGVVRRAKLNDDTESYLSKLERQIRRHTSATDIPREIQLLISPEYERRTDLELAQFAALVGIVRSTDLAGECTGRQIIRRIRQRIRDSAPIQDVIQPPPRSAEVHLSEVATQLVPLLMPIRRSWTNDGR